MIVKKSLPILLCILCLLLTACGSTSDTRAADDASLPETDLTAMSATVAYSYAQNLASAPDQFLGQRFRIRGTYDEQLWDVTGLTYHYIVVTDVSSCCMQGLEFVLTDEAAVYPQVGEEFEISGVLSTDVENGTLYAQITADQYQRF